MRTLLAVLLVLLARVADAACPLPPQLAIVACPAVPSVVAGHDLDVQCQVTNPNAEWCAYHVYYTPNVGRGDAMYGEFTTGDPNAPDTLVVPPYLKVAFPCTVETTTRTPAKDYTMSLDAWTNDVDEVSVRGFFRVVRP